MPREEYQVPTSTISAVAGGGGGGSSAAVDNFRHKLTYQCGDCGASVSLAKDVVVQCPHCACRVLYKERTKRMVQFEAR